MQLDELVELNLLCCPDDRGSISFARGKLFCLLCGREFPLIDAKIIDLLPSSPNPFLESFPPSYQEGYHSLYKKPFRYSSDAVAWGSPEGSPNLWVMKRKRQVKFVQTLLDRLPQSGIKGICDLSGGAGYYTLEYAKKYPWILHCDLSIDSLSYTYKKAVSQNINNIFFLRIDYFNPPLVNLDIVLCFDTLIRNKAHEILLLRSIYQTIASGKYGFVDFHNWWHNPLRRLGLLHQNFVNNGSYTKWGSESLIREAGISKFYYFPFIQEFDQDNRSMQIFRLLIPPTRHVFRLDNER